MQTEVGWDTSLQSWRTKNGALAPRPLKPSALTLALLVRLRFDEMHFKFGSGYTFKNISFQKALCGCMQQT